MPKHNDDIECDQGWIHYQHPLKPLGVIMSSVPCPMCNLDGKQPSRFEQTTVTYKVIDTLLKDKIVLPYAPNTSGPVSPVKDDCYKNDKGAILCVMVLNGLIIHRINPMLS